MKPIRSPGRPGADVAAEVLVRHARQAGVTDERVLEAVGTVPRALFVPGCYADETWLDEPFPIGHGQTTSQPSLIARMVEALELTATARVLEVGTGLGYQAALLGRLAGEVYTVELVRELADEAARRLRDFGADNVHVICGDGSLGLPGKAPFDGIVAGCAASKIPDAFAQQLAEGGRLVLPLRRRRDEWVGVYARDDGELRLLQQLCPVRFVPLVTSSSPTS